MFLHALDSISDAGLDNLRLGTLESLKRICIIGVFSVRLGAFLMNEVESSSFRRAGCLRNAWHGNMDGHETRKSAPNAGYLIFTWVSKSDTHEKKPTLETEVTLIVDFKSLSISKDPPERLVFKPAIVRKNIDSKIVRIIVSFMMGVSS
jgi:hypothetical protein